MNQSKIIIEFIEQIWNNRNFELLDQFIHPNFLDHSLPSALEGNVDGMKKWIEGMGISFEHQTIIEDQVCENDKCILKIRIEMKHTGLWRNLEPTGIELKTSGYRFYKLKDGKIIEHWALVDGQTIENEIKNASTGCKI